MGVFLNGKAIAVEHLPNPDSVLVCGGRDYANYDLVEYVLDKLRPSIVIQGGCRGADELARRWAQSNDIHCATVPALWRAYGPRAGPIRNGAMLLLNPEMVVAFPGGRGTRDMQQRAEMRKGVNVLEVVEE